MTDKTPIECPSQTVSGTDESCQTNLCCGLQLQHARHECYWLRKCSEVRVKSAPPSTENGRDLVDPQRKIQ